VDGGVRLLRRRTLLPLAGALLVAVAVIALAAGSSAAGAAREGDRQVAGGGKTIIEGGSGPPANTPVTTLLAFHASGQSGAFECLALATPTAAGPESGQFEVNVMYVTGKVSSVQVNDQTATLRGTANVTGIGAGTNVPFTAIVRAGGPGTTIVLEISGLTFHEIMTEGQITIERT
jgi:hypothetical protein